MKLNKLLMTIGIILVSFALAMSCSDDDKPINNGGETPEPPTPPVIENKTVTTHVHGFVLNEKDQPISGATVKAGDQTVQTNADGFFFVQDAKVNETVAFVTAEKNTYFEGIRSWIAEEGGGQMVTIKLLPKKTIGTIDSKNGGEVKTADGLKLQFPANAVVTEKGEAYTGKINVAAQWLSPVSDDMPTAMPGDLTAIDAEGDMKTLVTYGMFAVELTTDGGQKLQVAEGKNVAMTAPIPDEIQDKAPAEMPLWHFDNSKGVWIEDGIAKRVGNEYVGDVSHFSWWNIDFLYPDVTVTVKFVDKDGNPVPGLSVKLNNSAGYAIYISNDNGVMKGRVPTNTHINLTATHKDCGVVATDEFSVAEEDYDRGTIVVSLDEVPMVVTGEVKGCEGIDITGKVTYYIGETSGTANIVDGKYEFSITTCKKKEDLKMQVRVGTEVINWSSSIQQGTNKIPTIWTCAKITIEGDINNCNGQPSDDKGFAQFIVKGKVPQNADFINGKYKIEYYVYNVNDQFVEQGNLIVRTSGYRDIYNKTITVKPNVVTRIETLIVPDPMIITGSAENCNGPIANGEAQIDGESGKVKVPIVDGKYTYTQEQELYDCDSKKMQISILDYDTSIESEAIEIDAVPGTNTVQHINMCNAGGGKPIAKVNFITAKVLGKTHHFRELGFQGEPSVEFTTDNDSTAIGAWTTDQKRIVLCWGGKIALGTHELGEASGVILNIPYALRTSENDPTIPGRMSGNVTITKVIIHDERERIEFAGTYKGRASVWMNDRMQIVDIEGTFEYDGRNLDHVWRPI